MTGIGKLKEFAPRIVFIPFVDVVSGPVDTVLNVVLFVPLGLFSPCCGRSCAESEMLP